MMNPGPVDARPARAAGAFCALLVLVLLLGHLPYRGVRHDAILYYAQALAHLNPAWAVTDFFFAHGSQDRYSLFSTGTALLYARFGATAVDVALLLGAWAVFVWALHALTRELSPRLRWLGVLAAVAASHYYGGSRVFGFLEPFLTARTWAEPLVLVALVCLQRGRLPLAALALFGSMLCHPLMAVPMGAVMLAYLVGLDRRWAWLLGLLLPIAGLALAGMAPFSGLLATYDSAWFAATLLSGGNVFLTQWQLADFSAALTNLGVLWLACRDRHDALARAGRAALVTAPVLCLLSFVAVDFFHNVLITQLQLWRVLWIVDVLAMLNLPVLLAREWARPPNGRLAAVAVFVAVFVVDSWLPNAWAIVAWAGATLWLSARGTPLKPSIIRLAAVATGVVGLALNAIQSFNETAQLNIKSNGMAIGQVASIPFTLPILTLPIALLLILAWERGGRLRALALAIAALLLLFVVANWDQRSAWARYLESARPGVHPFATRIPPGAQVYWHDDVLADWVLLQRPQFISENQVSGLLFNRPTAMVGMERLPALDKLRMNQNACNTLTWYGADSRHLDVCQLSREALLDICRAKPTHADFLVSTLELGAGVVDRWRFVPADGSAPVTYVLYECAKLQ